MHASESPFLTAETLDRLTSKEREVLDLIVARHTSKEIARLLEISPNTVEQRLRSARVKLGTWDRNESARRYSELLATCKKVSCDPPVVSWAEPPPVSAPPEPRNAWFTLRDAGSYALPAPWEISQPTGLSEVLDRRFGKAWRFIAILLGGLGLALFALALVAISWVLGMLF